MLWHCLNKSHSQIDWLCACYGQNHLDWIQNEFGGAKPSALTQLNVQYTAKSAPALHATSTASTMITLLILLSFEIIVLQLTSWTKLCLVCNEHVHVVRRDGLQKKRSYLCTVMVYVTHPWMWGQELQQMPQPGQPSQEKDYMTIHDVSERADIRDMAGFDVCHWTKLSSLSPFVSAIACRAHVVEFHPLLWCKHNDNILPCQQEPPTTAKLCCSSNTTNTFYWHEEWPHNTQLCGSQGVTGISYVGAREWQAFCEGSQFEVNVMMYLTL